MTIYSVCVDRPNRRGLYSRLIGLEASHHLLRLWTHVRVLLYPLTHKAHKPVFIAYTLVFNIRRISSLANAPAASSATPQSQEMEKQKIMSSIQRDIIRPIVACCLTFGLDDAIDSTINEAFGVLTSPGCGGITG
jgi:hypothetical protein